MHIPSLDEQIAKARNSRGVSVTSPVVDAAFNGQVLFQWEPALQDTLELSVFTAETIDQPEIFRIDPNLSTYELKQQLKAGLYYWKIRQLNGRRKKQIGLGRYRIVQEKN